MVMVLEHSWWNWTILDSHNHGSRAFVRLQTEFLDLYWGRRCCGGRGGLDHQNSQELHRGTAFVVRNAGMCQPWSTVGLDRWVGIGSLWLRWVRPLGNSCHKSQNALRGNGPLSFFNHQTHFLSSWDTVKEMSSAANISVFSRLQQTSSLIVGRPTSLQPAYIAQLCVTNKRIGITAAEYSVTW